MPEVKFGARNGFEVADNHPVVVAVGAVDPHGKAIYCQAVAVVPLGFAGCVNPIVTEFAVIAELVKVFGLVQVGIGAHVIFANHPAPVTVLSEVNTKVKQPLAAVEVNGPGKFAPVNVPE